LKLSSKEISFKKPFKRRNKNSAFFLDQNLKNAVRNVLYKRNNFDSINLHMKKIILSLALLTTLICIPFASAQQASSVRAPSTYKLRATDVLTMGIFQDQDIQNVRARISADGTVTLPLIERVHIQGLTLEQARERITELYQKDYFVKPDVSLDVTEYSKQSCYVTGQVGRPSEYIFPIEEADSMTITKVIAGCGGFTTRANRRNVIVKRKFADGKEQVYNINVRNILRDSDAADFPIVNGDLIQVEEDII
jgi:polysaccharide export outer membrane protein